MRVCDSFCMHATTCACVCVCVCGRAHVCVLVPSEYVSLTCAAKFQMCAIARAFKFCYVCNGGKWCPRVVPRAYLRCLASLLIFAWSSTGGVSASITQAVRIKRQLDRPGSVFACMLRMSSMRVSNSSAAFSYLQACAPVEGVV